MASNVLLGYADRVAGGTLAGGSFSPSFVRDNLKDSSMSKYGRFYNALRSSTRFRCAFASKASIRALALANHNMSLAAKVRFRAGLAPIDIDFTTAGDVLDDRFTMSGATNSTRVDFAGRMIAASRQNLILQSKTFDNASWAKTATTIVANATTGPTDGDQLLADAVWETTANSGHVVGQTFTYAAGIYTFSCLMKAGLRPRGLLQMSDGVNSPTGYFDLVNGAPAGTGGAGFISSEILPKGNGWYLCSVTGLMAVGAGVCNIYTVTSAGATSFIGDNTAAAMYIVDAQLEIGSVATNRIITTTVAVTVNDARFDYDPLDYVNAFLYSEDLTKGTWAFIGATALDASTVQIINGGQIIQSISGGPAVVAGASYTFSCEARLVSGNGDFKFKMYDGVSDIYSSALLTATSTWQQFSGTVVAGASSIGTNFSPMVKFTGDGVLQIREMRVERGASVTAVPFRTYGQKICRSKGLLGEESRTNLCLRNRDGSNASWTKTNMTATRTAQGIDEGLNTATVLTATAANGTILQAITSASAARITTAYVRRRTGTGTIQMTQNGGTLWTTITVQNYWTRVLIPSATVTNPSVGFKIVTSGDAIEFDYFQIESADYPTSPIYTTTASVTRGTENGVGTGLPLAAYAGTLYTEFDINYDTPGNFVLGSAMIHDGTNNNRVFLGVATLSDVVAGVVDSGGVNQVSLNSLTAFTYGAPIKAAIAWTANDAAFCHAGGTVLTDNTVIVPVNPTQITLNSVIVGQASQNGHLRRLVYWPFRITNAQLQSITTNGPDAIGYDSGWIDALQFQFKGDEIADYGKRGYPAMVTFPALLAQYTSVDVVDELNSANYVEIGRYVAMNAFQPAINMGYGYQDSRVDVSDRVQSLTGKWYFTERRRAKHASFNLPHGTQNEADFLHEFQDVVGTTGEVLFVPYPDDAAKSQRYGGLGYLSELTPLDYPYYNNRSTGIKWEEKL